MLRIMTQRKLEQIKYAEYLKGMAVCDNVTEDLIKFKMAQHGNKSLMDLQIDDILKEKE
ncbi:hypothetical protein LCGC14_0543690 [marine sediment metagenome]|uniref:Uncharacterized protein n=1 Tax=marine sediment metagenome TaxID=412755 RepID=A0A0F9RS65_9ZZZZ